MKKLLSITAALLASAAIAPADAAIITVTGNFSGTLEGQAFGPQGVTFTLLADEGTPSGFFGTSYTVWSLVAGTTLNGLAATLVFQGGGYTFSRFSVFDAIQQSGVLLFSTNNTAGTVTAGSAKDFQTSAGLLRITGGTNLATTITPGAVAVPEPATWGLMLAGFGLIGAGLRSRRRSTSVTYA